MGCTTMHKSAMWHISSSRLLDRLARCDVGGLLRRQKPAFDLLREDCQEFGRFVTGAGLIRAKRGVVGVNERVFHQDDNGVVDRSIKHHVCLSVNAIANSDRGRESWHAATRP